MAFCSLPAEVESLARAIHKFQCDTSNKKAFCIDPTLPELVNRVVATKPINRSLLNILRRRTREAAIASSRFYNSSWLIDTDKFSRTVAHFDEITVNSQIIDFSLQQSIMSAVTSAVATVVAAIQVKHKSEMLSHWEMIEKSLFLRESPSTTPPPDPNVSPKAHPTANSLLKNSTERWNQAKLDYFDPHLNRTYGKDEIVSIQKDVYYRNVVLFVHRLQSLVTFQNAAFVKANIAISLQSSVLEWYTSKLSNFDHDILNNDQGVKSWVNTFSHRFKVPTSVALGLLTNETYYFKDAQA